MDMKNALLLVLFAIAYPMHAHVDAWHLIPSDMQVGKVCFIDSTIGLCVHSNVHISGPYQTRMDDIYRTGDGGHTWTMVLSFGSLSDVYVKDVLVRDGAYYFNGNITDYPGMSFSPYVIASTDSGQNWSLLSNEGLYEQSFTIDVVDTDNIWAFHTYLCKYNNEAWRWDTLNIAAHSVNAVFDMADTAHGLAGIPDSIGSDWSILYRTRDGGHTFDSVSRIENVRFIHHASLRHVWVITDHKVLESTDSGYTWQTSNADTNLGKNCFSSSDSMNLWIGCEVGYILHTSDGGQNWSCENVGTTEEVTSISAVSNTFVWAATADSTLWGLGVTGIAGQDAPQITTPARSLKAYPNPTRGHLTVSYTVTTPGHGSVRVYDITGRLVKTIASGPQGKGEYTLNWNWRNEGRTVSSGVYFIKSSNAGSSAVERIVLIR
jgi:hypothetical protein